MPDSGIWSEYRKMWTRKISVFGLFHAVNVSNNFSIFLSNIRAIAENKLGFVIKKEALAQLFSCEFCKVSKENLFNRTRRVAAFVEQPTKSILSSTKMCQLKGE